MLRGLVPWGGLSVHSPFGYLGLRTGRRTAEKGVLSESPDVEESGGDESLHS
jgi:hypothetical protein